MKKSLGSNRNRIFSVRMRSVRIISLRIIPPPSEEITHSIELFLDRGKAEEVVEYSHPLVLQKPSFSFLSPAFHSLAFQIALTFEGFGWIYTWCHKSKITCTYARNLSNCRNGNLARAFNRQEPPRARYPTSKIDKQRWTTRSSTTRYLEDCREVVMSVICQCNPASDRWIRELIIELLVVAITLWYYVIVTKNAMLSGQGCQKPLKRSLAGRFPWAPASCIRCSLPRQAT